MTPREHALRMREIARLRELQHRQAAVHASACVVRRDEATRDEQAQREVVASLSREWSRALSAQALDPLRFAAWAALTRRATNEAERLGSVARTAEDIADAAVDAFVVADTIATHAGRDAARADADHRRHREDRRDTTLAELRLARRSHA